jgi:hypothetical protein
MQCFNNNFTTRTADRASSEAQSQTVLSHQHKGSSTVMPRSNLGITSQSLAGSVSPQQNINTIIAATEKQNNIQTQSDNNQGELINDSNASTDVITVQITFDGRTETKLLNATTSFRDIREMYDDGKSIVHVCQVGKKPGKLDVTLATLECNPIMIGVVRSAKKSAATKDQLQVDAVPDNANSVNTAKAGPAKIEPSKVVSAKASPAKIESSKVVTAKAVPAKIEPSKVVSAKAGPATSQSLRPNIISDLKARKKEADAIALSRRKQIEDTRRKEELYENSVQGLLSSGVFDTDKLTKIQRDLEKFRDSFRGASIFITIRDEELRALLEDPEFCKCVAKAFKSDFELGYIKFFPTKIQDQYCLRVEFNKAKLESMRRKAEIYEDGVEKLLSSDVFNPDELLNIQSKLEKYGDRFRGSYMCTTISDNKLRLLLQEEEFCMCVAKAFKPVFETGYIKFYPTKTPDEYCLKVEFHKAKKA